MLYLQMLFQMVFIFLLLVFNVVGNNLSSFDNAFEVDTDKKSESIQLFDGNGKSYYFGIFNRVNYFQAVHICEIMRLRLLKIENAEENDLLSEYIRSTNKGNLFWTAGTNLYDGSHWAWITNGEMVDYTNWAVGNPDNKLEHCLAVNHSKDKGLTWVDTDCLFQAHFICEKGKVGAKREWKDYPGIGRQVGVFVSQKKTFYLGRYEKATFEEAMGICKMVGMQLASIDNEEENDKIYNYIRQTHAGEAFWSGGTRIVNGVSWVWISSLDEILYTNWKDDQPDSSAGNCIQLNAVIDKGLFWSVSNCLFRLPYICSKSG